MYFGLSAQQNKCLNFNRPHTHRPQASKMKWNFLETRTLKFAPADTHIARLKKKKTVIMKFPFVDNNYFICPFHSFQFDLNGIQPDFFLFGDEIPAKIKLLNAC